MFFSFVTLGGYILFPFVFLSPSIMLELQKVYITTNFLLFPLFTLFLFHFSSYLGDEEVFANVLSQVADKFIRLDKH